MLLGVPSIRWFVVATVVVVTVRMMYPKGEKYAKEEKNKLDDGECVAGLDQVAQLPPIVYPDATLLVNVAVDVYRGTALLSHAVRFHNTCDECSEDTQIYECDKVTVVFCNAVKNHSRKYPEASQDNDNKQCQRKRWRDFIAVQEAMHNCCEHAKWRYDEKKLQYPREDEEDAGNHGCYADRGPSTGLSYAASV